MDIQTQFAAASYSYSQCAEWISSQLLYIKNEWSRYGDGYDHSKNECAINSCTIKGMENVFYQGHYEKIVIVVVVVVSADLTMTFRAFDLLVCWQNVSWCIPCLSDHDILELNEIFVYAGNQILICCTRCNIIQSFFSSGSWKWNFLAPSVCITVSKIPNCNAVKEPIMTHLAPRPLVHKFTTPNCFVTFNIRDGIDPVPPSPALFILERRVSAG